MNFLTNKNLTSDKIHKLANQRPISLEEFSTLLPDAELPEFDGLGYIYQPEDQPGYQPGHLARQLCTTKPKHQVPQPEYQLQTTRAGQGQKLPPKHLARQPCTTQPQHQVSNPDINYKLSGLAKDKNCHQSTWHGSHVLYSPSTKQVPQPGYQLQTIRVIQGKQLPPKLSQLVLLYRLVQCVSSFFFLVVPETLKINHM